MPLLCRLSYSSGRSMIPNTEPTFVTRLHRWPRAALVVLVTTVVAACGGSGGPDTGSPTPGPLEALPRGTLTVDSSGGTLRLDVWIAETAASRQRGLMHVERIDAGAGMVFLFDEPTDGAFWMKDTLIPLSIAFWDEDGAIVGVLDMEPCRSDPCPLYSPGASYVGVVEVNRGVLAAAGVGPGSRVELERGG
jgi:uncharacterized membrane protein (UPF0127 family)